jgi:predicted RecB family nuclease
MPPREALNFTHGVLISDELFSAFLKCKTKAYLTALAYAQETVANPPHPIANWQRHLAGKYLAESCDRLRSADREHCFVGTPPSQDLSSANYRLIIQPHIAAQDLASEIHALERRNTPTLRRHSPYVPIRFVPSENISKHHKLLLAFDALVLWKASGRMPMKGIIIHGLQHLSLSIKLDALVHETESLVGKLRILLAEEMRPDPVLIKHCPECNFEACCRKKVKEKDDLSLLANLATTDRSKLNSKGIFTVTQLAYTFRPRRRPKHQASRREKYHHALKALAIRDRKIHVVGKPELMISGTPVFIDVEGLPDRGFYYLVGLRIPASPSAISYSLWADTPSDEEKIWQSFLEIVQRIDNPVLIHYGAYETSFLKRLAGRYPASANAAHLEALIKQAINLLTTTYAQIYFPTYSNGLKEVARYLGFQWSHVSASGLQALIWRQQWEETADPSLKDAIITYNRQDCEALELVTHAVERVAVFAARSVDADTKANNANEVCVHSEDLQRASKWRKFTSPIPALEAINEAAHWDYQRDRVYVRNAGKAGNRKRFNPAGTKRRPVVPHVNKEVVCSVPSCCPSCCSTNVRTGPLRSRIIYDLHFGKASAKRWIVRYVFRKCDCLACGEQIRPPEQTWGRGKYGWNLIAFLIYEIVELCVPQRVTTRHANRLFGLALPRSSVAEQKKMAAKRYEETRQILLRRITEGPLVHADETPIVTQGNRAYVWVFCNFEDVVYVYSENREASTMQALLKDFKGVLVSDFYTAYDSIDCRQQKCLIHLMRDLNDDMLKNPYDDELREIVRQFGDLLRPIIDTVDRRGLKKRFMHKHRADVDRFYKWLLGREWQGEVAAKCRQRFEKNRKKLFTFLEYDEIPWNNNNAEHAMKAFAALRDVIEGTATPSGIQEYLVLLSLSETCRYKNVDFLDFLCSGEKDVDAFATGRGRASVRKGD